MWLEELRRYLMEARISFQKLEPPQKTVVVSLIIFILCSVVGTTTLTFLFLGAGLTGFWLAASLINQKQFFSSRLLLKCLPTLIDPQKPGGTKYKLTQETSKQSKNSGSELESNNNAQELSLNFNIQKLIAYILQDFVLSWFNDNISSDDNVPEQLEDHLNKLSEETIARLCRTNPVSLLCIILELFRLHVHRYRRARTSLLRIARKKKKVDSSSFIASFETFALLHPAVQNESTELEYLRRLLDVLQRVLLSPQILQCKSTHFLLNEILSVNVLKSLVDLISDPDTVNEIIVLILSDDDIIQTSKLHEGATTKDNLIATQVSRDHELVKGAQKRGNSGVSTKTAVNNPPPTYSEVVTDYTTSLDSEQSKVHLQQESAGTKKTDNHDSQSRTKQCRNAKDLDLESCHQTTNLGDDYQQETPDTIKSEDKGQQNIDTVHGKSADVGASVLPIDKCANEIGAKLADKMTDSSSGSEKEMSQSKMTLVPEVKVYQTAALARKSSGVRSSYLKRLGILGTKPTKEDQPEDAEEVMDDSPSNDRQETDQNIPKQSSLSSKLIPSPKSSPASSPHQSPKETKSGSHNSVTTSSNYPFPIPFTSIGQSLPLLKPSQTKSQTSKKDLEKEPLDSAEKVQGLSFTQVYSHRMFSSTPILLTQSGLTPSNRGSSYVAPVPVTALGPSIPVKLNSKETDTDNESEGKMSRSSSSSSFASVTYDEDQLNTPFEEIDFQFAYDKEEKVTANEQSNDDIMSDINEQTKQSTPNVKTKNLTGVSKASSKESFERPKLESRKTAPLGRISSLQTDDKLNIKSGRNSEKRLSWQGEYVSKDGLTTQKQASEPLINQTDRPNINQTGRPNSKLATISKDPHPIVAVKSKPSTNASKETTFQPIAPAPTTKTNASPKKEKPTLTRSKTTPALLSIQGVAKQVLATSQVRLMEAKVGRFHISSVNIPSVEITKDRSGKEFVLYCIQYDVTAQGVPSKSTSNSDTSASALTGVVRKSVKRRHREFVNLHSRLDENTRLKRLVRGLKDPPRRMSVGLAFGAVSKTVYQQRKVSLEHYLQQLVNQPMLGHSEEIAAFLALAGDAHIEFVKKRTDIAPKIDEFLQWVVPNFVSTVKSAVPRAVADLGQLGPAIQALSPPGSPKRKQRGRDFFLGRSEGAFSPTPMDNLDIEWVQEHCEVQNRNTTQVHFATHAFLQDQYEKDTTEPIPEKLRKSHPTKPVDLGPRFEGDGCDASELAEGNNPNLPQVLPIEEIELLDKIMALLTEAMHVQGQPSWILDEKLQKGVCVMIGKPLDSWIKTQIQSLVSEQWCAYYLALIQDAIWPDGKLIEGKVVRTEEEKETMKRDALQCLIDILPGYLSHVIGKNKWQASMEIMLDSLQDPQLNRHLVFTLLDLLLEAIASEVTDHEFQNSLLNPNANQSHDSKAEIDLEA